MRAKTAPIVLASAILALTLVGSGASHAAGKYNFTLCNYATRGAVWARFVSYHNDRGSWMSSGQVYIAQGRCANFDHDGEHVYYYATNERGAVWAGSHNVCIGEGYNYDIFVVPGDNCSYGSRGFHKIYGRNIQEVLGD